MRYLPLTSDERAKILKLCGVSNFAQLTSAIPDELKLKELLDIKDPMAESELIEHISGLAAKVKAADMISFLGQGVYAHSWPRVIDQISNRGEFLTAYTPYQPEISQGTLQMIFEYQSMISELMGCEVSNASLYDGATSVVEGILMAARLQGQKNGRVLLSEGTFDRYRKVVESYLLPLGFEIEVWRAHSKSFLQAPRMAPSTSKLPVIAVVMQSPNKWGLIEDWSLLKQEADIQKTKSIGIVTHAHSCALFEPPGKAGVDIVTGEAQTLGIPVGFGGPHLGVICCKKSDVRQMPGRLVGLTEDINGQRAFCITLATREQHIRREKATSNICSNQNLMALRACMYMTLMGPEGMRRVAEISRNSAYYARECFKNLFADKGGGVSVLSGELLNEICLLFNSKNSLLAEEFMVNAEKAGIIAGSKVSIPSESGYVTGISVAFTETHKKHQIDKLVECLPANHIQ